MCMWCNPAVLQHHLQQSWYTPKSFTFSSFCLSSFLKCFNPSFIAHEPENSIFLLAFMSVCGSFLCDFLCHLPEIVYTPVPYNKKHRWSIRTWTTDWLKTGYYKLKLLFSESQISFACNKVFPLCKHVNMVSMVLLLEEELGGCWFSFFFVANLDLRNDNAAQQGVHKISGDESAPSPLLNKDVNFSPVLENRPQTPTTCTLSNYKV